MILNVRNSLLGQNLCSVLCFQPTNATFSFPDIDYKTGDTTRFTASFVGGGYEWRINGHVASTAAAFNYTFSHQGWYKIELLTTSLSGSQCSNRQVAWVKVYCSVKPRITVDKIKLPVFEDVKFTSVTTVIDNGPMHSL